MSLFQWLSGKKTYLISVAVAALAFADQMGYHIPSAVLELLGALGLASIRHGVSTDTQAIKTEIQK